MFKTGVGNLFFRKRPFRNIRDEPKVIRIY